LLHDGWCAAADLCDLDDDNDGLTCYYASFWYKTCNILDLLGETLSLKDVISKDETTQTGESHAIVKLAHALVVAEDINRPGCIIILLFF
jgi:hypothetical protein